MEWFRWYGGTFNDPKLQWVAAKSCQSVAAVLAVWVAVLERAHSHEQRGCCEGLDFESMDVALGLEDNACADIFRTMIRKGMIVDGDMVAAWEKRQPKREDDGAADRQKSKRERDKLLNKIAQLEKQLSDDASHSVTDVTHCHAESRQVTTEESRLEEKREEKTLKTQQQHTGAQDQIAEAVEAHRERLEELFPDIDRAVAIEKLLHHFRESERLIDPWMTALKWLQREFKPEVPAPRGRDRPGSRQAERSRILASNAAACRDFCAEG